MKYIFFSVMLIMFFFAGYAQGQEPRGNEELRFEGVKPTSGVQADSAVLLPEGIVDQEVSNHKNLYVSPVYPNPANAEANLNYALQGNPGDVRFVLLNLFGSRIEEIEITENAGSLKLNTSGLTEGIYFYSFLIGNESHLTRKLIIKR